MNSLEEQIRKAIEEGKFDDLPGKGKPLHLDDNPHADPDWALAYHVLQSSGYTLPWIETRKEIEADLEAERASLRRAWEWKQRALEQGKPESLVEAEWGRALVAFCEHIESLNQRIKTYNLEVPNSHFQLPKVLIKAEILNNTQSQ